MNQGIDLLQAALVPLAAAGVCAWANALTKDSTGGKALVAVKKVVGVIGGAVMHGKNDKDVN